jgi:hypothetical protein
MGLKVTETSNGCPRTGDEHNRHTRKVNLRILQTLFKLWSECRACNTFAQSKGRSLDRIGAEAQNRDPQRGQFED